MYPPHFCLRYQTLCFYCPKLLPDDLSRRLHIANSPPCYAAQRAVLEQAQRQRLDRERHMGDQGRQSAALSSPDAPASTSKRRRVTVESIPDETETNARAPTWQPSRALDTPSTSATNEVSGPSNSGQLSRTPASDCSGGRRWRRYRGLIWTPICVRVAGWRILIILRLPSYC